MRINLATPDNMYSRRLSGDSLNFYRAIIDSLSRGDLNISCHVDNIEEVSQNVDLISKAVCEGNPELFFINQEFAPALAGNTVTLTLKPCYDMKTVEDKYDALCKEVNRISEIIARIPNKVDQLYRLNEYLSIRVGVNFGTDWIYGNAYGALISCTARCEGFSKAAKLILNKLGFKNEIIVGTAIRGGDRVAHAWNEVEVNGKNYYFDFTWNAGLSINGTVSIPLYTFLDRSTMLLGHDPYLCLENDDDYSMLFWKIHHGDLEYLSDLSSVDVLPTQNNYFAIARMPFELNQYEIDYELVQWAENAFGNSCFAMQTCTSYAEDVGCAIIYFLNT